MSMVEGGMSFHDVAEQIKKWKVAMPKIAGMTLEVNGKEGGLLINEVKIR